MKKLFKSSVLFALVFTLASAAQAQQKFGHLNTGNLLVKMPETKGADDKLKVFQDSLVKIGQDGAKVFQAEVEAFSKRYYEVKDVTPMEAQKKQEEFQQKEAALKQYQDQVASAVAAKRQALIAPILDKVQKAIDEVGKEGKYNMIFDTSVFNTILFAQESDDIEPLVKKKLGLL